MKPILSLYILFSLCLITSTVIMVSIKSIRSGEADNKLRGNFIFVALITFFIGATLDAALEFAILGIVLVRLLVISSAIEYYFGFV